jgi:O-methyltransferase domain
MITANLIFGATVSRANVETLARKAPSCLIDAEGDPDESAAPVSAVGRTDPAMSTAIVPSWKSKPGTNAKVSMSGPRHWPLRPMLRFFDQISYPTWQKLADAVRTGNGQAQFGKFDKRQQEIFSAGVESFSGPGAAALATNYDFGHHRKVLDVAGGTGSFLVAVLKRHANLRGTLFELPGPCAVARQKLAKLPEGSRIDVVEGDVFRDPLPAEHDALIVANTAHIFSVAHNIELMHKMRAGVQPGTRLLLVDLWTNPSHTQPGPAALISGEFLVISGEGQAYSEQEADTWFGQTGWKKIEKTPLAGPTSVIVAEAV